MIKNPQVGDIVRVRSTERSNLVVLWDVSRPKYVQGILLHTSPELATDMDVVLARRAEGRYGTIYPGTVTPYPLVICCDLYGQFLRTQVDKHIAHIDNFPVSHPLLNPDEIAQALGGACPSSGAALAGPRRSASWRRSFVLSPTPSGMGSAGSPSEAPGAVLGVTGGYAAAVAS